MSDPTPFGSGGPFEDLMKNLVRLFSTQGRVNWEIARQIALWTATGGQPDANPEPLTRVRLEELLRVAELQVGETSGLSLASTGVLKAQVVSRSEWASRTLEAWRPWFERLAEAVSDDEFSPSTEASEAAAAGPDQMAQLFSNLPQLLGPLLFGLQAGAMVGQLAVRSMGQYDLPMPRPASDDLLFVARTIDEFASDWSLPPDDVRLWVCLQEVTVHAVLGRPHVRARVDELIGAYVSAFRPDPSALESRLSGIDPTDLSGLQSLFGDPERLLGEMQSDEQRRLQVPLQAALAAVSGYVDHVLDNAGKRLIGSYGRLTEALRRRRLEEEPGGRMLGQLFGVALDEAGYERGQAFVAGVLERAGEDGLRRLWATAGNLPTPAEITAPGLWLARIDLPEPGND